MNLPKQKEAKNLVTFIENDEYFQATEDTFKAWKKMKKNALNDGIELVLVSAFRSIKRQQELLREKVGCMSSTKLIQGLKQDKAS